MSLKLPVLDTLKPVTVGIAVVAGALLLRFRWSVLRSAFCALLGMAAALVGLPRQLSGQAATERSAGC